MAEIANNSIFSQTDASNTSSLPGISGSSAPSQIDDSIRALIGAVKREHDWRNFTITSGGSANAYTLTYSVAPAAYYAGQRFGFTTNFSVTGSATVNVNSLGAKTIKKIVAGVKTNLSSGDIVSGDFVDLLYDGTDMVWVNKGFAGTTYTVNAQTQVMAVDTADFVGGYDTSGTAESKFSVNNLHKAVNTFTAETAVAVDDVVGLYDTSAATMDKATIQNVLKAINNLTEDTSPDTANDFVLTYDTSATDVKKAKPSNLNAGAISSLGTVTTMGATTKNLSVTLTGYKILRIMWVSVSNGGTAITLGNSVSDDVAITHSLTGGNNHTGYTEIDLADGRGVTMISVDGTNNSTTATTFSSPITAASTNIFISGDSGQLNNLDNGSMRFFAYK